MSSLSDIQANNDLPIVVDLDNTLLKTDSLDETLVNALRENPFALWRLPAKLVSGRAATKHFLAHKAPLQADTWPVNEKLVEFLEQEACSGRKIVLATAADQSVGASIANRFSFISEVIASSPDTNMKGRQKAETLRQRFPDGFVYAGDAAADLEVWRHSQGIITVNARDDVKRRAAEYGPPTRVFDRKPLTLSTLSRALRLHQWVKNALVFIPLILGGRAGDPSVWLTAMLGFIALGLTASATYVVNDLCDLPSDRRHRLKRSRPLASGELSIRTGAIMALLGLSSGLAVAAYLGPGALLMLGIYVVTTFAYSFFLKSIPILDVFIIASLFTIRLGLGIILAGVELSHWLLVFSMFVFLSLSMAKRHTEVLWLSRSKPDHNSRRGYAAGDAPLTLGFGLSSMLGAVLILILYLIEDGFTRGNYTDPIFLWALPPALFLFLGRIWLLSQREELHDDPVVFVLTDRVSLGLGFFMALSVLLAIIGVHS